MTEMLPDPQEYVPTWDVKSGLNVRLPFLDIAVLPFEYFHVAFTVSFIHKSVYTCPATGLPMAVITVAHPKEIHIYYKTYWLCQRRALTCLAME